MRASSPRQSFRLLSPLWMTRISLIGIIILGLAVLVIVALDGATRQGLILGGVYWQLPVVVWFTVALLAAVALFGESLVLRLTAILAFGVATIGALGYLEPRGVFHDSWQNVGLGQLALIPSHVEATRQVAYIAGSPISFILYGVLSKVFPDTPGFLRAYPMLCVLIYCAGLYILTIAFAEAYVEQGAINREQFGLMSVFAFLALAPNFLVRINPAPQSLAFALMPFCLAALMKGKRSSIFRGVALATFMLIVFSHPITTFVIVGIGSTWLLMDHLSRRQGPVTLTTVILYLCIFLSWLIYMGLWIIRTSGLFAQRIWEVINSGQHATVSVASSGSLAVFIWLHRGALGGVALLLIIGIWLMLTTQRTAGLRLVVWLAIAAAWLPLYLFGEFADRGPLFASLPGALVIGLLLSQDRGRAFRWAISVLMLITTLLTYLTAYSNHIGEVITRAEVSAFQGIAKQSFDEKIIYGYTPPLTGETLSLYSQDRLRVYTLGAADFSYERLAHLNGIIVISDQMQHAAAQRGPEAVEQLKRFKLDLLADKQYELIFDNGSVVAFRAKQP